MKKFIVIGIILLFLGSSIPALGQASVYKEYHSSAYYTFKVAFITGHYDISKRGIFHFELVNLGFPGGNTLDVYGLEKGNGTVHVHAYKVTGGLHFGSIGLIHTFSCKLVAFNVIVEP
jgi:hypothetical protein